MRYGKALSPPTPPVKPSFHRSKPLEYFPIIIKKHIDGGSSIKALLDILPSNIPIEKISIHSIAHYCYTEGEISEIYIEYEDEKTTKNVNYEKELISYNSKLRRYNRDMEIYEKKLIKYNEAKKVYYERKNQELIMYHKNALEELLSEQEKEKTK